MLEILKFTYGLGAGHREILHGNNGDAEDSQNDQSAILGVARRAESEMNRRPTSPIMRFSLVMASLLWTAMIPPLARAEGPLWPCDSVGACAALKTQIEERLALLAKQVPSQIVAPARDAVGNLLHLTLWDAQYFCDSAGLRLPSPTEMAYYAQAQGALGISASPRPGFNAVGDNPGAPFPTFYYNPLGYTPPAGELGTHWLWLYSDASSESTDTLAMGGGNGRFFYTDPQGFDAPGLASNAVVCINAPAFKFLGPGTQSCDTVDGCHELSAQIDSRINILQTWGPVPTLTEPPRNADGSIQYFDFQTANQSCARRGLRLPTARELALFAQSYGAQVSDRPFAGYSPVADFYYRGPKTALPAGNFEWYYAWSATPDPVSDSHSIYAMTITAGAPGEFASERTDGGSAGRPYATVRCVSAGAARP